MKRSLVAALILGAIWGCSATSPSAARGGAPGFAGALGSAGDARTSSGGMSGTAGGADSAGAVGTAGGAGGASGAGGVVSSTGGRVGSGAGGPSASCAGDPTVGESVACDTCTTENCAPATDGCSLALFPTEEKRRKCLDLYCCLRASHCKDGDALHCWCGDAPYTECITRDTAANGPCLNEFRAAAESTAAAMIKQRFIDPHYAIGGAVNLHTCRSTFCSPYSDPPVAAPKSCDL